MPSSSNRTNVIRVGSGSATSAVCTHAQARRRWGTHSLREWIKVTKTRELWLSGEVRIHLDQVEGLGRFIEFEAKVSHKFDVRECHQVVAQLREMFAQVMGEPVSASYSDLVEQVVAEKTK